MISTKQRLPKDLIPHLFQKGKKIVNTYFIIKYTRTDLPLSRFCIIISTKISNKAVERNLIRRRIYEAVRLNKNNLKKSCDIIFIGKKEILKSNYREIEESVINIFKKLQ